ncbi:MAG: hypothetical protein HYS41_07185 [Candidatus Omnitrophica bacterium]|nr:hypothetical protein [Candidatus Omnitrophota bacterium]
MTPPTAKLFWILALAALTAGCQLEIGFQADTKVLPDGSVTRTTRYEAFSLSDKTELEKRYELPPSGQWEEIAIPKPPVAGEPKAPETHHLYSVTRRYAPGEPMVPDHGRKDEQGRLGALNRIKLSIDETFFTRTFDYEERFRDGGSREEAAQALQEILEAWIARFSRLLEGKLKKQLAAGQIQEVFLAKLKPLLLRLQDQIRFQGGAALRNTSFFDELAGELEKEGMVNFFLTSFPPPAPQKAPLWKASAEEAYEEAEDFLEEEMSSQSQGAFFGAYGLPILQPDYTFHLSLRLPGKILYANSTRRQGKALVWEFDRFHFLWDDHILHARSRVVRTGRVLFLGGMLALVLALAMVYSRRWTS